MGAWHGDRPHRLPNPSLGSASSHVLSPSPCRDSPPAKKTTAPGSSVTASQNHHPALKRRKAGLIRDGTSRSRLWLRALLALNP